MSPEPLPEEEEERYPGAMRRSADLSHWAYFFMPEEDRRKLEEWRSYGKCFGRNELVEVFNPPSDADDEDSDKTARVITIAAKRYCLGLDDGMKCSMLQQCRDYAVEQRIYSGVWGGLTVRERRRYAASKKRATK